MYLRAGFLHKSRAAAFSGKTRRIRFNKAHENAHSDHLAAARVESQRANIANLLGVIRFLNFFARVIYFRLIAVPGES